MTLYSRNLLKLFLALAFITPAFAGVLPLFNPSYVTSKSNSFYVNTDNFLTNDPFTLKDLFNGMKTDTPHIKSGENTALGSIRADIGYNYEKYGYIGYTYREEVLIDTNKDTMELLYLATNKKDLPVGKTYNLDLTIKAFAVQGIEYANNVNLYKSEDHFLNIGFGIEALYGMDMQDGNVVGRGVTNARKDYSFDITSHYDYTHNYLYKLNVRKASAYGYSSHLSLFFKKENFSLLLLGNDIFGKLYWKNLPHSDVYLSSNNKVYDANGYVKYKPTIHGYEGYKNYTQILLRKYRAQMAYKYAKSIVTFGNDWINGIYMPYIQGDYKVSQNYSFGLGYETRYKSITVKTQYKDFILKVQADDIFKPTTLGLKISYLF